MGKLAILVGVAFAIYVAIWAVRERRTIRRYHRHLELAARETDDEPDETRADE